MSKQPLASAKFQSNRQQALTLSDADLRSVTPCEVIRDALPKSLANQLLEILLADAAGWTRGSWFLGGKEHFAPRTSAYYALQDRQVRVRGVVLTLACTNGSYVDAQQWFQEIESSAKDVSSAVKTQAASAELQEAAALVCEHVNRSAGRVLNKLAEDDRCTS